MKSNKPTFFSPGQKQVLESLRPVLKLATGAFKSSLPLRARTSTLIVGQSGTGKTHVVRELAKEAGVAFWEANVACWLVLGAHGGNPTLVSLARWIVKNKRGVIFLDELDKLTSMNEYTSAVRLEIHDLADSRFPEGGIDLFCSTQTDEIAEDTDMAAHKTMIKSEVEEKLRNSFLIVGAGSWQNSWAERQQQIGFHHEPATRERIDRQQILKSITPELLARFRSEILFLDPLSESDYLAVMMEEALLLPEKQRLKFVALVVNQINNALDNRLGMRIFEEAYTQLCVEEIRRCGDNHEAAMHCLTGR